MHWNGRLPVVVILLLTLGAVALGQGGPTAPTGLMVEYIRDSSDTVIEDAAPEYTWVLSQEVVFQRAYQVLVASSRESIDQDEGDVWDSGVVRSGQSVSVPPGGAPLAPNTRYFWKVRAMDQEGRWSPYSEAQAFRTGTFDEGVTSGNVLQTTWAAPARFEETGEGAYFVDFGKAAFGTVEFDYDAEAQETLTVRLGEKLSGGERIDRNPGGTIRFQEVTVEVRPGRHTYRVDLPPVKRNTSGAAVLLPERIGVVMPFRYCEIEGAEAPLAAEDLRQMRVHTYWEEGASSFSSSDDTRDQIWYLCKYSMKATSFTGLYVDGDRERIPYEADAYINQLGHYGVDREYAMAKRTIEYFMHHPTWPTEWLLHTALMAYQDYLYTGELELVDAYYGLLKNKTLIALAREDGLISSTSEKVTDDYMRSLGFQDGSNRIRDIVDWPPAQKDTGWQLATEEGERDGYEMVPVNTVVNCFFYENMVIMERLAAALGKSADAEHFAYMAAKVKKSINGKLLDRERGVYMDGEGSVHASLHANMMPLAFGLVPPEHIGSVAAFVKSRGMACSVYGAQYLLEGLYRAGEDQYALDLMRSKSDRSWWNMIRVGSTLALEAWDLKYKPNLDWNHAWGAAPANIIPRGLWGITPLEPGFAKVRVEPQFGDLERCSLTTPTIRGPVSAAYERENTGNALYTITLPGNTVGELHLAALGKRTVTLNGHVVNPARGFVPLAAGANEAVVSEPLAPQQSVSN